MNKQIEKTEKITGNATLDVEVGKGKLFEEKQVFKF